jgi:dTDP-6-deoxy-L-talose 4-dehydrogenase (NAD+)
MKGTVLLTGAAGFVGRQVLRALTARGARVRVVVRDGRQAQLEDSSGIETIVTTPDLFAEGPEWWRETCVGIDTVIHVAWYAEPGKYLQSEKNIDCLVGTLRLAQGAANAGIRRFVGVGTCFEYDLSGGTLSIDTPLRPSTPYAGAKAATFLSLAPWLATKSIEFAWCRLFYLYGEGEDSRRLVAYLHATLGSGNPAKLTSGNQVRDFIDVALAGRLIADAAAGKQQGAINICSGVAITIRQLAEAIAREYGRLDLLEFGARPDNLIDPSVVVGVPDQPTTEH